MNGPLDAVGCLYVLEGSTLGGQIILRRAAERLGIDADTGAGFFHGYGAQTGAMWRGLVDAINLIPADSAHAAMVEDGARRTFSRFIEVWSGVNTLEADAAVALSGMTPAP